MRLAALLSLSALACSAAPEGRPCTSSRECGLGFACVDQRCVSTDAGRTDGSTSSLDAGTHVDAGPIDAPACIPTETPERTCNLLDDDCNGYVDDVDVGGDGICDCLRIGVIGDPGPNPSSGFQAWLEMRGSTVVRFGLDDAPLDAAMLAPFDVIVLDDLRREYTMEESQVLRAYVEAGGGLMSMTGYNGSTDRTVANTLLAAFEVSYAPGLLYEPVTDWVPHPISMGITSVTFAGGYHVVDTGGFASTVIAREAGGAVGVAQERGMGRVFVWGDEWIEYDSEWSTMPMIEQLWVNLFAWLGPRDRCVILI